MAIDVTLPGFAILNQLKEPFDGTPDQNSRDNCVAASIADAVNWLTGSHLTGDELTDDVYGGRYIGPESAAKYQAFCQARGVSLTVWSGGQAALVAQLRALVAAGVPALVTMPSNWNTPYADPVHPSGSTHVGVCCGYGPGMLRVMNPWNGFFQDEPDAWWQARLCYGQIWPLRKSGRMVSTMWKQVSPEPNLVMADANGVQVHNALASHVQSEPTLGDVVPGCKGETYINDGKNDGPVSILPLAGPTSLVVVKSGTNYNVDPGQFGAVAWGIWQRLLAAQADLAAGGTLTDGQQRDLAMAAAMRAALTPSM
jgi:hypothetical protein